uniref:Uncharacterized protein n=1 Tax=Parascaris equorum TaxID=6256 RepID=A0A914RXR2_PAREQ
MITADEPVMLPNIYLPKIGDDSPVYTFCDHLASVKAIAFNPQLSNSLATGGGTADRTIKFYNLSTGTLCHSEQTDSQVWNIASLFSASQDRERGRGSRLEQFSY